MIRLLTIFFLALQLVACYEPRRMPAPSRGITKNQSSEKLNAHFKIFNTNSDSTRFYFDLQTRPQDYYYLNDKSKLKADYKLTYELFRTGQGKKQKIDSASLKLVDLQTRPLSKKIIAYLDCAVPKDGQYAISISINNLNNNANYSNYVKFTKSNCTAPENYLIQAQNGEPLMEKNFLFPNGLIRVSQLCAEPVKLFKVTGTLGYAKPPFASEQFAAENNYEKVQVTLNPDVGHSFSFSNLDKGVYAVQTTENSGIVFYHFNNWYPFTNDTAGFYEPLVYICTKDEFETFQNNEGTKSQFETFWLNRAGNKLAARKAINEYYKRVFDANLDYTSVLEGWKTDRGMISIIFGKPSYTEKQLNKEIWIYRTSFNATLSFTFQKIDNPYTDNDYHLERDISYKPQWYNAVENWRNGRPFTLTGN